MSDQTKTEQPNEAHISPSGLNAGLGNERINMKLAPCNKHKGDQNLICFKIRHDNGAEATQQEIFDEITRLSKIEADMETLREMWNLNSLSAWADDIDTLAKIMKPNV